ncbi:MAG: hypothetical protein J6Y82_03315 [Bacteroidales bacterium]|nr:hypothetical protein [Bacteroidales bacterium]
MKTFFKISALVLAIAFAMPSVNAQMRVSIFGDSYSTFDGYLTPKDNYSWYFVEEKPFSNDVHNVEQTWWHQVISGLGAQLELNNSFSGSTICNTGYDAKDATWCSFITRLPFLGEPDLILVCGATNDSWANSPIGEYKYGDWTTEELMAFRPAMAKLCEGLRLHYPRARVLFILNDGLKLEINESVHTITKHYGIECLDLQGIDKQKGHPSVAGMKQFADQVLAALKKSDFKGHHGPRKHKKHRHQETQEQ